MQTHSSANVEWTASGGKLGPSQTNRVICTGESDLTMQWRDMATCPRVPGKPILVRINGFPRLVSWAEADAGYDSPGWEEWLFGENYNVRLKESPDAWAPVPE